MLTIRTACAVVAALATAAALSACTATGGTLPAAYNPNSLYNQCADEMEEMQDRQAGISRRARAAEAAYMATRDAKIAAANKADLERERQQLSADIAANQAKCRRS